MQMVDEGARATCIFQGRVFEASVEFAHSCGSAVFVRRFMRSEVARRIDGHNQIWDGVQPQDVIAEVDAEYNGKAYGTDLYPKEVLYWMGYIYRYGCVMTQLGSAAFYGLVGAREMRDLYYAYHTLDPAQCVERILEAKHVNVDEDMIARGVEALRRIRNERFRTT